MKTYLSSPPDRVVGAADAGQWQIISSSWMPSILWRSELPRIPHAQAEGPVTDATEELDDAEEPGNFWKKLVAQIAAGDEAGYKEFRGLYRPAILMLLQERLGPAKAKAALDGTVRRILNRIASGELTEVSQMALEVRAAGRRAA